MATLYISYFGSNQSGAIDGIIKSETITTSAITAASGVVPTSAQYAQITSTAAHYVTIGTGTPTAAATNSVVQGANLAITLRVNNGTGSEAQKIAAITA